MPTKHSQTCPIAGFLNLFGDAWTWLIIREAFYGTTRFSDIQRNTGAAKNLLSSRLSALVENGIFTKRNTGERGTRFTYHLTAKGESLVPVLVTMVQWSNEHIYGASSEPILLFERDSERPLDTLKPRSASGKPLNWHDILTKAGPGANDAARLRMEASDRCIESIPKPIRANG